MVAAPERFLRPFGVGLASLEDAGFCAVILDEAADGAALPALADGSAGVAERAGLGLAGEEGEDAVLSAGALGDRMLLDQRLLAMAGDCVEVEIERCAGGKPLTADGATVGDPGDNVDEHGPGAPGAGSFDSCRGRWKKVQPGLARKAEQGLRTAPMPYPKASGAASSSLPST